jgi:hypothetical protein
MTLHGIAMGDQPFEYIVPTESEAGKVWRVYTHIEPCILVFWQWRMSRG